MLYIQTLKNGLSFITDVIIYDELVIIPIASIRKFPDCTALLNSTFEHCKCYLYVYTFSYHLSSFIFIRFNVCNEFFAIEKITVRSMMTT